MNSEGTRTSHIKSDQTRGCPAIQLVSFGTTMSIAIVLALLLVIGGYSRSLHILQDVGKADITIDGLYPPEYNGRFDYAFTRGDARFRLPNAGIGHFVASAQLAGPNESLPVPARLEAPNGQVDLGRVAGLRVYHVLVPTDSDGNLSLSIESPTMQLPSDAREIGVVLDWLDLRSVGPIAAPWSVLWSVPVVLFILLSTLHSFRFSLRRELILAIVAGIIAAGLYIVCRTELFVQGLLVGASLYVALVVLLTRFGSRSFARGSGGAWFTSPLRGVATMFLAWRIALWIVGGIGVWYSGRVYRYANGLTLAGSMTDRSRFLWKMFVRGWMHFDSGHYQTIALHGYTFTGVEWPNVAFFPLYPLLIRLFMPLTGGSGEIAALLISHLATFAAMLLLYDLVAADFERTIAYRALVFLLVFPTSIFFVAGYTESLALALAIAVLWCIRRERWWLAGVAGFFLALTRVPGVLAAPVLGLAYLQRHNWHWRALRADLLAILLPPLGLGLFMLFQWWRFGTPFAFLVAQRNWNGSTALPWTTAYAVFATIRTATNWPMLVFELIIWASFILLTVVALLRLPLAYGVMMALLLLPPYVGTQSGSWPRHVLMGFPAFVVMAVYSRHPWIRTALIATLLPLLVIAVVLFVNGFWVG